MYGRLFTSSTRQNNSDVAIKSIDMEFPKNTQNDKIENIAVSIWLSLIIDGTGKWKYSPRP
jgi:hypothetical protein